jgi:hypothetical protein
MKMGIKYKKDKKISNHKKLNKKTMKNQSKQGKNQSKNLS